MPLQNGRKLKMASDIIPPGFTTFNQSSAFTKVSGFTEIAYTGGREGKMQYLHVPFTSWFLISCLKEGEENNYKIGWAVSLS
jgi:hypothetical protein